MEMSGFRPNESSHVAQQIRRDRLRVQQILNLSTHHLDQNVPQNSHNPDMGYVRNVRNVNNLLFDPNLFSPELLSFSINANNAFAAQDSGAEVPQNYGNWRSLNPPQSLDNWMSNYTSGTTSNHHMFVKEANNMSPPTPSHLKPSAYHGYQPFSSPPAYHNTLHDVVTTASLAQDQLEMASWTQGYVNRSATLGFDNSSTWMDRPIGSNRQNWSDGEGEDLRGAMSVYSNPQGLSLSLSSNPPPSQELQASTSGKSGGYLKPSIIRNACGTTNSLQDIAGTSTACNVAYNRSTGPLGPFTGYATILKSSKFLKPAEQLLEDFCRVGDHSKKFQTCEASDRISGDRVSASATVSVSNDEAAKATQNSVANLGTNNSSASSSAFYGSNELSSSDGGAAASSSSESFRPEYLQKKAKLIYMQEEVCRRYRQYHQQMEMVVSSFESVAGLSSATPYMSFALHTISKHFKSLTSSIKDQLKHMRRSLGEVYSTTNVASTTGCGSKSDKSMGKLKYKGLVQKHKATGGVNVGFSEPQQHIWRPQRGLPDQSVAILRTWLFDHFLHPYPTETDKHMLAAQTSLSRNQVSNWFINARVRVWKPMVEEIHLLETRGSMEACQDTEKDEKSPNEGISRPNNEHCADMHRLMPDRQLECSSIASLRDESNAEVHQNQEIKRSRIECQVPSSMDNASMGFMPYNRSGIDVGGNGAVSLTLGLRHGEGEQQLHHHHHHHHQQQQQQQQQHQLRKHEQYQLSRQLGGHISHDFVG